MNKIKKIVTSEVFWILAGLSVFPLGIYFMGRNTDYLRKNGLKTVGTIISTTSRRITYNYYVKSKLYESSKSMPLINMQIGEKYEIRYDPNDFENHIMMSDKPIFDKNAFLTVRPIFVEIASSTDRHLYFRYEVNKNDYFGDHANSVAYEEVPKKAYMVFYHPKNPYIGYLMYDSAGIWLFP